MPTITRENAAAFRRPLTRPDPVLPVQAMKTYSVLAPLDTHWRTISCEEAGCLAQHNGFEVPVDLRTDLGHRQAEYIRARSGRSFTYSRRDPHFVVFTFPPGTECFTQHKTRRSRPPMFVVRPGDHRGYGRPQVHSSPDAWINDFAGHQERLARVRS